MSLIRRILILLLLVANAAPACQICVPIPTRSAADRLIAADTVAFARENPDKPFSLLATETLKGKLSDPAIDLFLDTQSRRLLSVHPDRHIICLHDPAEPKLPWRRIGITNSEVEPLVRSILRLAPEWQDDPDARLAFFAPLLGNKDPFISTLAHLEIGNAPYSSIRRLGSILPSDKIHAFLDNFRMTEWHALYILILAQSNQSEDQERIREAIESASRYSSSMQLPAWATAFIEIDGTSAIDLLESQYFSQSNRRPDEIQSILLALSTHGSTNPGPLRERIISSYRRLLDRHPDFAPILAADLELWKRRDLVEPIASLLKNSPQSFDLPATLALRSYIRSTAEIADEPPSSRPISSGLLILVSGLLLLPVILKLTGTRRKTARSPEP